MELTGKSVRDLIKRISEGTDKLKSELTRKERQIEELKLQNDQLREKNLATLAQIREHIKELEKIRSHYVSSNHHSS